MYIAGKVMQWCRTSGMCAIVLAASLCSGQAAPPMQNQLARSFTGSWTGVLQYRDFQSDGMVRLPTWLEITGSPDGALHLTYTYDDGPTKTVVERSTVSFDIAAKSYTVTSDRDHASDTYQVTGLDNLLAKGVGVLTMTGAGQENAKPVDVRITLTIGRNLYMFRKETRAAGEEFRMRDEYVFTRREPTHAPKP
jgi:hypothetical protein